METRQWNLYQQVHILADQIKDNSQRQKVMDTHDKKQ